MDEFDQLFSFSLPSARGGAKRVGVPPWMGEPRELCEADLAVLEQSPGLDDKTPAVKTLRASHHSLAKALASGCRPGIAGSMTGYSPSRVSILQNDPAFAELVEYYKAEAHDIFIAAQQRLADLGTDAISELQERLEDTPETFGNKDLMHLVEITMDRSVAPSKKAQGPEVLSGPAVPAIQINFVSGGEAPAGGHQAPLLTQDPSSNLA